MAQRLKVSEAKHFILVGHYPLQYTQHQSAGGWPYGQFLTGYHKLTRGKRVHYFAGHVHSTYSENDATRGTTATLILVLGTTT